MNGVTLSLVIGKPARPQINVAKSVWRFVFGPLAILIVFKDIDVVIGELALQYALKAGWHICESGKKES